MRDVIKGPPGSPAARPRNSRAFAVAGRARSIGRRVWGAVSRFIWDDTGGIDETALPSGYAAPQRRGSRMVRNLWHIPF